MNSFIIGSYRSGVYSYASKLAHKTPGATLILLSREMLRSVSSIDVLSSSKTTVFAVMGGVTRVELDCWLNGKVGGIDVHDLREQSIPSWTHNECERELIDKINVATQFNDDDKEKIIKSLKFYNHTMKTMKMSKDEQ